MTLFENLNEQYHTKHQIPCWNLFVSTVHVTQCLRFHNIEIKDLGLQVLTK